MRFLTTPYGRKNLEAISGTLLLLFLIEHLGGNILLLFTDSEPYRWYTTTLGSSWITRILEAALFLVFLMHIVVGLMMRLQYRRVRTKITKPPKQPSLSTRLVGYTGAIILIFLVVHLLRFFYPNRIAGQSNFDLYDQAHLAFASFPYTAFYVFSMVALASHLQHGIKSALFSFRFIPKKRVLKIRRVLSVIGLIVPLALGYIALHIYIF